MYKFNLDAYLHRIGVVEDLIPGKVETLKAVMEAQMRAIAFENLDVVSELTHHHPKNSCDTLEMTIF